MAIAPLASAFDLDEEHADLLRPARPGFVAPMLAARTGKVGSDGWRFEHKLDGYRCIAVCSPQGPRLWSRNGIDTTVRFRNVARDLPRRDLVLDGEAIAFVDGREDFGALQQGRATHLVLFDVLNVDGLDTRALPWHARRKILEALPLEGTVARSAAVRGDPQALLERACQAGWEGLIAKRVDAPYRSGRTTAWRKLKCTLGQEFVIGGYQKGTDRELGALLIGYHTDGGLRYAGKVGTGFGRREQDRLLKALHPLRQDGSPFADPPRTGTTIWVAPRLVCQVAFTEWTGDGSLRHPRYQGLRDDKDPSEVVREPDLPQAEELHL